LSVSNVVDPGTFPLVRALVGNPTFESIALGAAGVCPGDPANAIQSCANTNALSLPSPMLNKHSTSFLAAPFLRCSLCGSSTPSTADHFLDDCPCPAAVLARSSIAAARLTAIQGEGILDPTTVSKTFEATETPPPLCASTTRPEIASWRKNEISKERLAALAPLSSLDEVNNLNIFLPVLFNWLRSSVESDVSDVLLLPHLLTNILREVYHLPLLANQSPLTSPFFPSGSSNGIHFNNQHEPPASFSSNGLVVPKPSPSKSPMPQSYLKPFEYMSAEIFDLH